MLQYCYSPIIANFQLDMFFLVRSRIRIDTVEYGFQIDQDPDQLQNVANPQQCKIFSAFHCTSRRRCLDWNDQNPLNPASTEKFFFKFWSDFSVCFPLRPMEMRFKRKKFLSLPEVWFLDATRFVCLVLTGVRVANFFNITHFDLIFLHSVHLSI